MSPDSSFNTAVSFATNTNWQGYGGESTMSYLTQMLALTVQNFVSAATGMAVLVALIRGFARRSAQTIGNFWVDLTRTTIYILLPLSIIWSLALVSQGVVQTFAAYPKVTVVQPTSYDEPETDKDGKPVLDDKGQPKTKKSTLTEQVIAVGPAASQIAIKQLGTNGGGFFNVNSAHPLENSTPLSNFLEVLAILMIPAALCYTFGVMVGDTRQGWTVLAAMTVMFVGLLAVCYVAEQQGAVFAKQGVDHAPSALQSGGNMEGKEVRYGIASSALWATATTVASNGSVNSMHDSYTPIGGLVPMWSIQLGEVVYGGVGSGLYGMLMFAIVAVFVSGLMVGRTPEYLGKKIEAYEMKMSSLVILITPALVLIGAAVGVVAAAGKAGMAESRGARLQRGALRVLVGVQQQWQRLRRPERQHPLLQHRPRPRHAVRTLLAGGPGAGHCRLPRQEEDRPERSRDAPHAHAAVRRASGRRRDPRRSLDVCPGARPGADRRTPHVGRGEVRRTPWLAR